MKTRHRTVMTPSSFRGATDVLLLARPGDAISAYGPSDVAVAVNRSRIGLGTVGWMVHADETFGCVSGLAIFDGRVSDTREHEDGRLGVLVHPLPREYWIDGARIRLSGWEKSAPFAGRSRRFSDGTTITAGNARVLRDLLATPVREWLDLHTAS